MCPLALVLWCQALGLYTCIIPLKLLVEESCCFPVGQTGQLKDGYL